MNLSTLASIFVIFAWSNVTYAATVTGLLSQVNFPVPPSTVLSLWPSSIPFFGTEGIVYTSNPIYVESIFGAFSVEVPAGSYTLEIGPDPRNISPLSVPAEPGPFNFLDLVTNGFGTNAFLFTDLVAGENVLITTNGRIRTISAPNVGGGVTTAQLNAAVNQVLLLLAGSETQTSNSLNSLAAVLPGFQTVSNVAEYFVTNSALVTSNGLYRFIEANTGSPGLSNLLFAAFVEQGLITSNGLLTYYDPRLAEVSNSVVSLPGFLSVTNVAEYFATNTALVTSNGLYAFIEANLPKPEVSNLLFEAFLQSDLITSNGLISFYGPQLLELSNRVTILPGFSAVSNVAQFFASNYAQTTSNALYAYLEGTGPKAYQLVPAFAGIALSRPTCLASPPGDTHRLFVCEKNSGKIKVIPDVTAASPTIHDFLLLGGIATFDDQGILGLAFHPNYGTNPIIHNAYCYIFYSWQNGSDSYSRLSRLTVTNPDAFAPSADPTSELVLIEQLDRAGYHPGGDLHFGPDGYLYISLGDEGLYHDSLGNAQRIDLNFYSAIARIDVDKRPGSLEPNFHPAVPRDGGLARYAVPPDNPFIGFTSFNGLTVDSNQVWTEFWAVGFRHPWRFSFDSANGELWCGDVGEGGFEEVNLVTRGGNYGWSFREGTHDGPKVEATPAGFTPIDPIFEIVHLAQTGDPDFKGNSVIGGFVYRGSRFPTLSGQYIFGDYVSGNLWAAERTGTNSVSVRRIAGQVGIAAFGSDPSNGDVLVVDHDNERILRLVTLPGATLSNLLQTAFLESDLVTSNALVNLYGPQLAELYTLVGNRLDLSALTNVAEFFATNSALVASNALYAFIEANSNRLIQMSNALVVSFQSFVPPSTPALSNLSAAVASVVTNYTVGGTSLPPFNRLRWDAGVTGSVLNGVAVLGVGRSQTPWDSSIDAARYALTNVGSIDSAGTVSAVGFTSAGPAAGKLSLASVNGQGVFFLTIPHDWTASNGFSLNITNPLPGQGLVIDSVVGGTIFLKNALTASSGGGAPSALRIVNRSPICVLDISNRFTVEVLALTNSILILSNYDGHPFALAVHQGSNTAFSVSITNALSFRAGSSFDIGMDTNSDCSLMFQPDYTRTNALLALALTNIAPPTGWVDAHSGIASASGNNVAPAVIGDAYATLEEILLTVDAPGVLGNDMDLNGDTMRAFLVAGTQHGALSLGTDGGFAYLPQLDYTGTDLFTYAATDGMLTSAVVTVTITIAGINDTPLAANDSYGTAKDTVLTVGAPGVLGNDTDVDGDMLQAVLVAPAAHGALNLSANGAFVYTPSLSFTGLDTFAYAATDGSLTSGVAAVTINVGGSVDIPGLASYWSFDESSGLTATDSVGGNNGTLLNGPAWGSGHVAGAIAFDGINDRLATVSNSFIRAGSFTYSVWVKANVANAQQIFMAQGRGTAGLGAWMILQLGANNKFGVVIDGAHLDESTAVLSPTAWNHLAITYNGTTLTLFQNGINVGSFARTANYTGEYAIFGGYLDGNGTFILGFSGLLDEARVYSRALTPSEISDLADVPFVNSSPLAANDSYGTAKDTVLTVGAPGVLGNDTDVDGDMLQAVLVAPAAHGALNLSANGAFVYTPSLSFTGLDTFAYAATDGSLTSGVAAVTINVGGSVDIPGLASYWSFDESSGLTATDSVGGNNGTLLNGPAWGSGHVAGAIAFDGINDRLATVSNSFIRAGSFTYSVWVKANVANAQQIFMAQGRGTAGLGAWMILQLGANNKFGVVIDGAHLDESTAVLSPTAWNHLAITYNGTTLTLFQNGINVGSFARTANYTGEYAIFGGYLDGNGTFILGFSGLLDEARVYSRALTPSEISAVASQ